jgi:hypothetical protein
MLRRLGVGKTNDMDASLWCPLEEARPLLREFGLENKIQARFDLSSPYHDICQLWVNCGLCYATMRRDTLRT